MKIAHYDNFIQLVQIGEGGRNHMGGNIVQHHQPTKINFERPKTTPLDRRCSYGK
jgi:hypothetical protein